MIFILSGDIETGKSNSLLKWTESRNDVYGVLSPRNINGVRYILDVGSKECFEMQTDSETADTITIGRYIFLKSSFEMGNDIIKKSLRNHKSGYILIDELGKLELQSKGFHKSASLAIPETLNNKVLHLIIIVRSSLLLDIISKYNISHFRNLTIDDFGKSAEILK